MVAAGLLVALSLVVVGLECRVDATNHDFICYWSTAKLAVARKNPYDPVAILTLERAAGAPYQDAFVMRNPPWALFLVLPLGWLSIPVAAVLWTFSIVVAALASVRLLWPWARGRIPLLAWFFAPVILCAAAGQTATFPLLGVSLFLHFQARRPYAAGVALLLPAMKPHLFLLFWPVLLLDCWRRRDYRVLAGMGAGLAAAMVFAQCIDAHVWSHYVTMMRTQHAGDEYLPNISIALRGLRPQDWWLQMLPTAAGVALVMWQRWRQREWDWRREGAMVFAASVLTAPYSWPTDQALFLPAVLAGYARASKWGLAVFAALNVLEIVEAARHAPMTAPAYLWTAPAWMLWCAYAYLWPRRARPRSGAVAVDGVLRGA